jgi:hypothetical protein
MLHTSNITILQLPVIDMLHFINNVRSTNVVSIKRLANMFSVSTANVLKRHVFTSSLKVVRVTKCHVKSAQKQHTSVLTVVTRAERMTARYPAANIAVVLAVCVDVEKEVACAALAQAILTFVYKMKITYSGFKYHALALQMQVYDEDIQMANGKCLLIVEGNENTAHKLFGTTPGWLCACPSGRSDVKWAVNDYMSDPTAFDIGYVLDEGR